MKNSFAAGFSVIICSFFAVSTTATAQSDTFGGKYLCIDEAAGGIYWNETTKDWRGTSFTASDKFIFSLSNGITRSAKDWLGDDVEVTDYSITVKEFGSDNTADCFPPGQSVGDRVTVEMHGWVTCSSYFVQYRVNTPNLRYLSAYLVGFASGIDNNDNTPSVKGGTCTKID